MKSRVLAGLLLCGTTVLLGHVAVAAAPFEPAFRVINLVGECMVQDAGEPGFVPAEEGKAYWYGAKLKTGPNASLQIVFSADNMCILSGDALVTIAEDAANKTQKQILLEMGKLDITLADGYENANALVIVSRCMNIILLSGGKATIDSKEEEDLSVVVAVATASNLKIKGPQFEIPLLSENRKVSLSCSRDRRFVRLRNVGGAYQVRIRDTEGNEKMVDTVEDSVLRILQKPSDDGASMLVTILIVGPDGAIIEAVTFSEPVEGGAPAQGETQEPKSEPVQEEPKKEGAGAEAPEQVGDAIILPAAETPTTTTTTTTTVPPGDIKNREDFYNRTTTTTSTTRPNVTPAGLR